MNANMITIGLFIGILLMAGTVLVLTIIYFIRPVATSKGSAEAPNCKKKIEGKPFKIQLRKIRTEKAATPFQTHTTTEKFEKVGKLIVVNTKENKNTTQEKQVVRDLPHNNDKTDGIATESGPEKEVKTTISLQSNTLKDGTEKEPVPMKSLIVDATILTNSLKPSPDSISLKNESDNLTANDVKENRKTNNYEILKKELEPKMNANNVKESITTDEKEKTNIDGANLASSLTNLVGSNKGSGQKTSLDDLSNMFSKEVKDDSEATKLAKEMAEVEIGDLLHDGQYLVNLLKRKGG
jgi:hypothetical protein